MTNRALQEVITKLASLTPKELETVQTMAGHLRSGNGSQRVEDEKEDELFLLYSQISTVLSDKGIACRPWPVFRKTKIFPIFKQNFPEIQAYTDRHFGVLTRRDRQRLYRIYALATVTWVEQNPYLPLTLGLVVKNLGNISEHMTASFPGYAESGLLPMVLGMQQ